MADTDLFIAKESAITSVGGEDIVIHAGHTVVRAGHPLLKGREDLFQPLFVHYDVEPTEAPPSRSGRSQQKS